MVNTLSETTPCTYFVHTMYGDIPLPFVSFHRDVLYCSNSVANPRSEILKLQDKFSAGEFRPQLDSQFGFSGNLYPRQNDGYLDLTLAKKRLCPSGSTPNWHEINQAVASLSVLFNHLNKQQCVELTPTSQLLHVFITIDRNKHWLLEADISPVLARWLSIMQSHKLTSEVMQDVHNFLRGKKKRKVSEFGAHIIGRRNHLLLTCSGNCTLKPELPAEPEKGYRVRSHKTQNGIQVLALLAGLANLEEQARKEIK